MNVSTDDIEMPTSRDVAVAIAIIVLAGVLLVGSFYALIYAAF